MPRRADGRGRRHRRAPGGHGEKADTDRPCAPLARRGRGAGGAGFPASRVAPPLPRRTWGVALGPAATSAPAGSPVTSHAWPTFGLAHFRAGPLSGWPTFGLAHLRARHLTLNRRRTRARVSRDAGNPAVACCTGSLRVGVGCQRSSSGTDRMSLRCPGFLRVLGVLRGALVPSDRPLRSRAALRRRGRRVRPGPPYRTSFGRGQSPAPIPYFFSLSCRVTRGTPSCRAASAWLPPAARIASTRSPRS